MLRILALLLIPPFVSANHLRGHPMPLEILEIQNLNGVDCAKLNQAVEVHDSTGAKYLMVPVIQCWKPVNDFVYNGFLFKGNKTYNVWERNSI